MSESIPAQEDRGLRGADTPFDWGRHVAAIVRWHFDPQTGSPFWLRRAASLGFDPISEIRTVADLDRFPAVADEWRELDVADLIPRGCGGPFDVWESGGTTGSPRRVVDSQVRARVRADISATLDEFGFPPSTEWGHWLHIGPSGPHLVGTNVARLARMRGALRHAVDLDPRWVKRLYREGRADEARRYTAHVVEQALTVLRSQPVEVLTVTPPLLQALLEQPEGYELVLEKVRGIIWFGTSMSEETLRLLTDELLPGIPLVGWYGNTLMGIACQRLPREGDPFRCIFHPAAPGALIRLVDPQEPLRRVGIGEVGQVRLSVLTEECFLPWHLERDQAVRVAPLTPDLCDDLAQVSPLDGGGPQTEGVY